MTETASKPQIILANMAIVLVIAFGVVGLVCYGASAEVRHRFWEDLLERPGGPMTFRFILQPIMAAIAALHDGIKDATDGRSPYTWTILANSKQRGRRLREGLIATARVILLGLCMDVIYQLIVLKTFYPGEAAVVALGLAFLPYLFLRGPIDRIARWRLGAASTDESR